MTSNVSTEHTIIIVIKFAVNWKQIVIVIWTRAPNERTNERKKTKNNYKNIVCSLNASNRINDWHEPELRYTINYNMISNNGE